MNTIIVEPGKRSELLKSLLTIYIDEHALMLYIAVSPCALWLATIRSIDALIFAMAGHTLAVQACDSLCIGSSHYTELRE